MENREECISELDTKIKYAKFANTNAVVLSSKAAQFCLEHAQYYEQMIKELTEENEGLRAEDIIRLPLKVGDIVYSYTHFWREEDGISPYQITNITITQNKKGIWTKKYRAMRMLSGKTIDDQLNFAFDEIGETVFLTLIDADRALKGE